MAGLHVQTSLHPSSTLSNRENYSLSPASEKKERGEMPLSLSCKRADSDPLLRGFLIHLLSCKLEANSSVVDNEERQDSRGTELRYRTSKE